MMIRIIISAPIVMVGGAFVDPAPYLLLAPAPVVTLPAAIPPVSATSLPTPTESLAATATPSTSTATTEPSAAEPSATEAPSVGPAPSAGRQAGASCRREWGKTWSRVTWMKSWTMRRVCAGGRARGAAYNHSFSIKE